MCVDEGSDAKFIMRVVGKPKPTIRWFKEEVEIDANNIDLYEIVESDESVTFIIKKVKIENSGNYHAKIVNETGATKTNNSQLAVNYAPRFINLPSNIISIQNQLVKFGCSVDSMPKSKINWYHKDIEISSKDGFKIETDLKSSASSLTITKVSSSHQGKFSIKASNSVGICEHSFTLEINGNYKCKFFIFPNQTNIINNQNIIIKKNLN